MGIFQGLSYAFKNIEDLVKDSARSWIPCLMAVATVEQILKGGWRYAGYKVISYELFFATNSYHLTKCQWIKQAIDIKSVDLGISSYTDTDSNVQYCYF